MSDLYIKHPNGRLVQAPRGVLKGQPGNYAIDADKIKDGWVVATPADIKAAVDAEAKRAAAEKAGK